MAKVAFVRNSIGGSGTFFWVGTTDWNVHCYQGFSPPHLGREYSCECKPHGLWIPLKGQQNGRANVYILQAPELKLLISMFNVYGIPLEYWEKKFVRPTWALHLS